MDGTAHRQYTQEELAALKTLFDECDFENSGRIQINQLPLLLSRLGKSEGIFF
jgi:hypothetical protein